MNFREKFNSENNWIVKALTIQLFHTTMNKNTWDWTIKRTSQFFDISLSHASEDLMLAENIEKIENCKSRNEALKFLRNHFNRQLDLRKWND